MLFLSSLPMRYQPLHGDPQADTAASLWLEGSQAAGGGDGRIRSGDGRVREGGGRRRNLLEGKVGTGCWCRLVFIPRLILKLCPGPKARCGVNLASTMQMRPCSCSTQSHTHTHTHTPWVNLFPCFLPRTLLWGSQQLMRGFAILFLNFSTDDVSRALPPTVYPQSTLPNEISNII